MRESIRMVVVLTLIAVISAGVLSQVYNFAHPIIQANRAQELADSIFEVLPQAHSVELIDPGAITLIEEHHPTLREAEAARPLEMFEALDEQGRPIGFAYVAAESGYAGLIRVLVGVDSTTSSITGIKVLEHVETPGLGTKIEDESFRSQFVGKTPDDPVRVGNDIDNISGATISAVAVADAVRQELGRAVQVYRSYEEDR